jgi:hypothetical protein
VFALLLFDVGHDNHGFLKLFDRALHLLVVHAVTVMITCLPTRWMQHGETLSRMRYLCCSVSVLICVYQLPVAFQTTKRKLSRPPESGGRRSVRAAMLIPA